MGGVLLLEVRGLDLKSKFQRFILDYEIFRKITYDVE